jgi:putative ABC transport system permease protein
MSKSLSKLVGMPELADPDRVVLAGITLQGPAYESIGQRNIFWDRLLESLRLLPGVESASACSQLPFNYGSSGSILAEGEEYEMETDRPLIAFTWANGEYFQAIGTPLLSGRTLHDRDANEENMNIVVNRALAELYWPEENAVGKRLRANATQPWFEATVVGVADNFRQWGLEGSVYPEIFFPINLNTWNERWLVMRTTTDPLSYVDDIRSEMAAIDAGVPLSGIRTVEQLYTESSAGRRLSTILFGLFALLALILVATGIYGVMSYNVEHRTHEIGIRMALGAERNRVLKLVLGRGFKLSIIGIVIGLGGALITSGITGMILYQVSPLAPLSIVTTSLLLVAVGLISSFIPALRATTVDPIKAIQTE